MTRIIQSTRPSDILDLIIPKASSPNPLYSAAVSRSETFNHQQSIYQGLTGRHSLPEPSAFIMVGLPCCNNSLHHGGDQHVSTLNVKGSKADAADDSFLICFVSAKIPRRQVVF